MKSFFTIIFSIALSFGAFAQSNDTMFIHMGQSVTEFPVKDVDSITFYRIKNTVYVSGVSLNQTSVTLPAGTTQTLSATVLPSGANNKAVMWVSNNTGVATVKNGVITGVNEGSAIITVVTQDGTHTANCTLTVTRPEMKGGGPYILYNEDGSVKVMSFDRSMNLYTKHYPHRDSIGMITVWSHVGDYSFSFNLQNEITPPPARYSIPQKLLALSDPHGEIVPIVRILQGNGVIDQNLNWIYGTGHLMIIGDVQDRGDDQTTIFWLLYKLDAEARQAGGVVHHILGNHDVMIPQNDLRYITPKYFTIAEKIGVGYDKLWQNNSELGRWVNSRNTIEIVGDILFVHGGLSPQMVALPLTIEQINDTVRKYIVLPSSGRSPHASLIIGSNGPHWYRNFIDNLAYQSEADTMLARYGAEKCIMGHTRVDHMSSFYNGKIFGTDISNVRTLNLNTGRSMAIKVMPTHLHAVNANGDSLGFVVFTPPVEPPPPPPPTITPEQIVTYVQNASVESLKAFLNGGANVVYELTLMSSRLETWREAYQTQFSEFSRYTMRLPRGTYQISVTTEYSDGSLWYRGPNGAIGASDGQGVIPMTAPHNPLCDVTFSIPRSSTTGTPPSGYNGTGTGAISFYNFLQEATGFTIIQDPEPRYFWFRSKADPTDWFLIVRQ